MKRLRILLIALACLLIPTGVFARDNTIFMIPLWNAEIVDSGTSRTPTVATSEAVDFNRYKPDGFFSLQITVTGPGAVRVRYLLSNDGATYSYPTGASDIVTAASTSTVMYQFNPMIARYMKINITETAGATASVTAYLAFQ